MPAGASRPSGRVCLASHRGPFQTHPLPVFVPLRAAYPRRFITDAVPSRSPRPRPRGSLTPTPEYNLHSEHPASGFVQHVFCPPSRRSTVRPSPTSARRAAGQKTLCLGQKTLCLLRPRRPTRPLLTEPPRQRRQRESSRGSESRRLLSEDAGPGLGCKRNSHIGHNHCASPEHSHVKRSS